VKEADVVVVGRGLLVEGVIDQLMPGRGGLLSRASAAPYGEELYDDCPMSQGGLWWRPPETRKYLTWLV
jgi:hypothetical protein